MTRKPSIHHCHVLHKEVLQLPRSLKFLNKSYLKKERKEGKKYFFPLRVGIISIQRSVSLLIHLSVDGDGFGLGLQVLKSMYVWCQQLQWVCNC